VEVKKSNSGGVEYKRSISRCENALFITWLNLPSKQGVAGLSPAGRTFNSLRQIFLQNNDHHMRLLNEWNERVLAARRVRRLGGS
jgi:hypothetical protein